MPDSAGSNPSRSNKQHEQMDFFKAKGLRAWA
jgi:hypothetical protein